MNYTRLDQIKMEDVDKHEMLVHQFLALWNSTKAKLLDKLLVEVIIH